MDPQENQIEYSQESQDLIDQNDSLFAELQQQQQEEAEAAAAQAAADAAPAPNKKLLRKKPQKV